MRAWVSLGQRPATPYHYADQRPGKWKIFEYAIFDRLW